MEITCATLQRDTGATGASLGLVEEATVSGKKEVCDIHHAVNDASRATRGCQPP